MISMEPLSDRAWVARFPSEMDAACWASALRNAHIDGVVEVILAYGTVAVFSDPWLVDLQDLEQSLQKVVAVSETTMTSRVFLIPVLYNGPDLAEVAERTSLSIAEVIAIHGGTEYRVQAMGFQPGFPYAGDLPAELRGLPRRESPRPRVPRGSVAIVGHQTAIYPNDSPGGWHLLGKTPCKIAEPEANHFPIHVGDRLRFVPIDEAEYLARRDEPLQ